MVYQTFYDSATRIWSGQDVVPTYNPNVSIATVLLDTLARNPNFVGQINDNSGVRLTNEQIRLNTIRLAINLQRGHLGAGRNDVIGLVSKNHENITAVVFAAFALAAPINTLDPNFKAVEIANLFRLTQPKFTFCDSGSIDNVRGAMRILDKKTQLITIDMRIDGVLFLDDLLVPCIDELLFIPTKFEDGTTQTAVIICTSGTSGPSKGVSLSHALILQQFKNSIALVQDDVFLSFSSLYWLSGMLVLIASTLYGATRVVTTSNFEADLMLTLIEQYKINNADISSLRLFHCGGCNVPSSLIQKMNEHTSVVVCHSYGMSEIGGIITVNFTPDHLGTGMLKDGISVKIIDENGKCLGPLSDGEICVRTQFPLLGYFGDPVKTGEAFSSDGWYRSGDIGHFDEDGYLVLVDRLKDILFVPEHFPPSELETVLLRCPGVADVCVVGVPDLVNGVDLPAAFIIVANGKTVSTEDIEAIAKETLSGSKQLHGGVYFVPKFPLTPSGKLVRRRLKEMAIELYRHQ